MLFNAVLFKKRTYKEIMQKYDLACVAVRKAKTKLDELYSQDNQMEETKITQEALEKNEAYLKALIFVCEAFSKHTGGHAAEASEEVLEEIFKEIQAEYNETIHQLYLHSEDIPCNPSTFMKEKTWKARALGWVLGISPKKTEYDSNYFHKDRIYDAINNLHHNAYFYVSDHDEAKTPEINADFNLLMDFAKAVFQSR